MLFNSLGNLDSDRNSAIVHWIYDYLHTDEPVVEKGIDHVTESTRRINKIEKPGKGEIVNCCLFFSGFFDSIQFLFCT